MNKYMQVEKDRIFIDIAKEGCGSGCTYCYVKTRNKEQLLLENNEMDEIIQFIIEKNQFDSIFISLCPNTEPLKSDRSKFLVIRLFEKIAGLGIPIQISTKERISYDFADNISKYCINKQQVFFNISIPYIESANLIEPYAASIETRIENFKTLKYNAFFTSCLYIKPFSLNAIKSIDKYTKIITKYAPDYVCIGIDFFYKDENIQPCSSLYHPHLAEKLLIKNKLNELINFSEQIKIITGCEIVYSTACIIKRERYFICTQKLNKYDERLCEFCNKKSR